MMDQSAALPRPITVRVQIARLIAALERFPLSLLQLIFRLSMAVVFWRAGQQKLASWDVTLALFRDEYAVPLLPPEFAAMMATAVEVTCPILLALGLATRLATLPMLGMTAVIEIFVYPGAWSTHLAWTGMLLALLTRGPGAISLDHLLARRYLR